MIPNKSSKISLPEWLEDFRIPESMILKAYDNFTPVERSLIKTAIALANYHFSEKNPYKNIGKADFDLGFSTFSTSRPVDWTAIIFSKNFDSAALTCSAATLPILCGVDPVFAICLAESPSPAILTTLELCGIENIFHLDDIKCLALLGELSNTGPTCNNFGKVIVLDSDQNLDKFAFSINNFVPVFFHDKTCVACVQNPDQEFFKYIKTFLGSKYVLIDDPGQSDVYYIDNSSFPDNPVSFLTLTMPCMGFWIFPNLKPDFFKIRSFCFNMIESDPDF